MGNRAVMEFEGSEIGIYLHWNGGRNSVEKFLKRTRDILICTSNHEVDSLVEKVASVIDKCLGENSAVVGEVKFLDQDNYDNGTYIINRSLHIVGRRYFSGSEQTD